MNDTPRYTALNRTSWDSIAPRRLPESPAFFAAGGSTLEDYEPDLLPNVAGKRLLHLACANGNDTLSWAGHGADVTGVDISHVATNLARETAAAAGIDATFVTADMFDLPSTLGTFDIVYASWGVVCWVPDLDEWLAIIRALLRPGGTFALFEHHPLWEILGARGGSTTEVTADYFGRSTPTPTPLDQFKRPAGSTPETPFTSFVWPVADVVTAVLQAGLTITTFGERPEPSMWAGLDEQPAARLPGVYTIVATKPS